MESVSVVDNGEEVKEAFVTILIHNNEVMTTEGTRISIAVNGAVPRQVEDSDGARGTIKVDAKSSAIDFIWTEGSEKGKTLKSIYNVNKDALILCMAGSGKDRPMEFSAKKGSDLTLIRLKRVK